MKFVGEVKKFKHFSLESHFMERVFTGKLSGMDSDAILRLGIPELDRELIGLPSFG